MVLQADRLQLLPPDPSCPRQIMRLHEGLANTFQNRARWPASFGVHIPQRHASIQKAETKARIPCLSPDMYVRRAMLVPEKNRNYISFVSPYFHRNPSVRLFSVRKHF